MLFWLPGIGLSWSDTCSYFSQTELSDGIAMLVAGNDRIQAIITQLEEICKTIEVSNHISIYL